MPAPRITVSVVSHRQNSLVNGLLGDLARHCRAEIALVVTENVPDPVAVAPGKFADRIQVNANPEPRGFGANHNAAFKACGTPLFCVANPDISLDGDPFPALAAALSDARVGAVGP